MYLLGAGDDDRGESDICRGVARPQNCARGACTNHLVPQRDPAGEAPNPRGPAPVRQSWPRARTKSDPVRQGPSWFAVSPRGTMQVRAVGDWVRPEGQDDPRQPRGSSLRHAHQVRPCRSGSPLVRRGARPGGLEVQAPSRVRARRAACLEPPRRARARTPRDGPLRFACGTHRPRTATRSRLRCRASAW